MLRGKCAGQMPTNVGTGIQDFWFAHGVDELNVKAEILEDKPSSTLAACTSSSTLAASGESGGSCSESVRTDAKDAESDLMNEPLAWGYQIVFEQERRKVPLLPRAWRTPDPSPTRHDVELPRCRAPTLRLVRRASESEDSESVGRGRTWSRQFDFLLSRTPSPCEDNESVQRARTWSRQSRTPSPCEDGESVQRGRTMSRQSDYILSRTPSPFPSEAPSPYSHEGSDESTPRVRTFPVPPPPPAADTCEQRMGVLSPASRGTEAQVFFCVPYWLPGPSDVSARSSVESSASTALEADNSSLGSRGHPTACANACKFFSKRRGCKEGAACNRCHLCPWSRAVERL